MRIVFIQLNAPYLPKFAYQENGLAKASVMRGNDTTFITTKYIPKYLQPFVEDTKEFQQPFKVDDDGVKIYRQAYRWPWLPKQLSWRLGKVSGIQDILEREQPDLIYFHVPTSMCLFDVTDYVRRHRECVLCCDSHSTYKNSGKNLLSKYVLHRMLYRYILYRNKEMIDHFFYLSDETLAFYEREYKAYWSADKISLLPLGGFITPSDERPAIRKCVLEELHLPEDTILIIHSGKLVRQKRTKELLDALRAVPDERMRLVIVGKIADAYADELMGEISRDPRVIFLGWKTGDELQRYMIAGDLYAQPGTESSSLQSAMCCGCPVMLSPGGQQYKAYRSYFEDDKVFFIESTEDMIQVLSKISADPAILEKYREYSYQYASDLLDYRRQMEIIESLQKK